MEIKTTRSKYIPMAGVIVDPLPSTRIVRAYTQMQRGKDIEVDDLINELTSILQQMGVNEQGVQEIIGVVRMIVNRNTFLSNYDEKRMYQLLRDFADDLAIMLYTRYDDYDIATEVVPTVYDAITTFVESAMRRAIEEGERRFLVGTTRRTEIVRGIEQPQQIRLPLVPVGGGANEAGNNP